MKNLSANDKRDCCRPVIERWRKILQIISTKGHATAAYLSVELETSTKTIYRDMDFLRDRLLLPIESANDGYYFTAPITLCPVCLNCSTK